MAQSTLESLASKIYANALKLDSIAKENGVTPSLDDPVKSDLTSVTPLTLRNELIQAAKDLIYLSMGPADHVLSLAWSVSYGFCATSGSFHHTYFDVNKLEGHRCSEP